MFVRHGHLRRWAAALVATAVLNAQPAAADQAAAAATDEGRFDLQELRVLGNSVLTGRDIESTVYPFLGPGKTLKDVESARAALEKVYHDRGYGTVFVDIP